MKRIIAIAAISIFGISCETEERVINNASQNNLVANTVLTGKLMRVAQSPTAVDDIIDGTSCFAIQFPYSVVANGESVTLDSEADYQEVRDILNASATGGVQVTINFPVNVTYADYTEASIASQAQFDAAVAGCTGSVELSCMDLTYPLGINTYNSQNQLAETFDLGSKRALYEILENITIYDAAAFDFPINFKAPDGSVIVIENNAGLEAAIDNYTVECLDLLNPPVPGLLDVITDGTWYVSYFFIGSDYTATYQDYDFTFDGSGNILVTGPVPSAGMWDFQDDGGVTQLMLMFIDPELENIGRIWTLTAISETTIQLHLDSTGVQPEMDLVLSKN